MSFRIASQLEEIGIGSIGNLETLSEQHAVPNDGRKKMIFINDCRSGCVNVLTHGFDKERFLYIDISPFTSVKDFDIAQYINLEVLPALNTKWNYQLAENQN